MRLILAFLIGFLAIAMGWHVRAADLKLPKPRHPVVTVRGPLAGGPVRVGKDSPAQNAEADAAGRHLGMP